MWFEELTGFAEDAATIYSQLFYSNGQLYNNMNGRAFVCGELSTPKLAELRQMVKPLQQALAGKLRLSETVADVQALHRDPSNAGAFFQVASQFNLLEMVSPDKNPEHGISNYQYDRTQGPACAIACGADTIYRNYFVEVDGKVGQSKSRQLDMLSDFAAAVGNTETQYWRMQNGYVLPTAQGLNVLDLRLSQCSEAALDELRSQLRIGIQSNTQVTLPHCQHLVTQAYCSALPVAYCTFESQQWVRFAQLILDAAYEATFAAAVINAVATGNNKVFLTLLGGGAFGNKTEWIVAAIQRAIRLYQHCALDVQIVSYGRARPEVRQLIADLNQP
ncbi:hypothetical protein ACFO3I_03080 [Rheinheimera marina]|uniref:Poly(ADP-ribose) glycohydrolase n=1 Tax=Rheinheimera marina TaxID=1774958 RepID=A0ABV9JJK2_9GAMM